MVAAKDRVKHWVKISIGSERECYFHSAWMDNYSQRWLFSVHVLRVISYI